MEFLEQQPEIIGTYQGRPPVSKTVAEPVKELAQVATPEEKKKQGADKLKTTLSKQVGDIVDTLTSLTEELDTEIADLKGMHSKRDEDDMKKDEMHKEEKKGMTTKSKEIQGQHKQMMKGKDTEIKKLNKLLGQKEKEVAKLFAQVKDALYNAEE